MKLFTTLAAFFIFCSPLYAAELFQSGFVEKPPAKSRSSVKGITLSEIPLCVAPSTPCTAVSYKTKSWSGCASGPKGCYERTFFVTLPAGFELSAEIAASTSKNAELQEWVRVGTNICASNCESTISGWLKRSQIAILSDFKQVQSWPVEQNVSFSMGDYEGGIRINRDATFTYTGGVVAEGHNYPRYDRKGSMYKFRNILWANTKDDAVGFFFVEQPDKKVFCWNQSNDYHSCFVSSFDSRGVPLTPLEFETAANEWKSWVADRVDLSFQNKSVLREYMARGTLEDFQFFLADLSERLKKEEELKKVARIIVAIRQDKALRIWRVDNDGTMRDEDSKVVSDAFASVRIPEVKVGHLVFGIRVHSKDVGLPDSWKEYLATNPPTEGCNPMDDVLVSTWPNPALTTPWPGTSLANKCGMVLMYTHTRMPTFISDWYKCKQFSITDTKLYLDIPKRKKRVEEWHAEICGFKRVFYVDFSIGPYGEMWAHLTVEISPKIYEFYKKWAAE